PRTFFWGGNLENRRIDVIYTNIQDDVHDHTDTATDPHGPILTQTNLTVTNGLDINPDKDTDATKSLLIDDTGLVVYRDDAVFTEDIQTLENKTINSGDNIITISAAE